MTYRRYSYIAKYRQLLSVYTLYLCRLFSFSKDKELWLALHCDNGRCKKFPRANYTTAKIDTIFSRKLHEAQNWKPLRRANLNFQISRDRVWRAIFDSYDHGRKGTDAIDWSDSFGPKTESTVCCVEDASEFDPQLVAAVVDPSAFLMDKFYPDAVPETYQITPKK